MLVLTRNRYQSIKIGKDIEVRVLDVNKQNGQVRIGISAPDNVHILRAELKREER